MLRSRHGDTGLAVAWMLGVLVVSGLLFTLCLPGTVQSRYETYAPRDLLHGEWLLIGSLLALPIYRASRTWWWTAIPLAVVPGAQMVFIASSAVAALQRAGVDDLSDRAWYVLAAAQAAVFAGAAVVGAARDLADRRWLRLVNSLTASPGTSASQSARRR